MKIFAETERLLLREILPTDVDGMFELHSDPEVHRYLGNKTITSKEQTLSIINFVRQHYTDYDIGRWAVIDKNTADFIGWAGLEFVTEPRNNHKNYYDLGYRLIRRYWGQGIATEASVASLAYAFDTLKANQVYAMADCENMASNKLLKKVGLTHVETFDFEGVRHNWYKIGSKEFESRNPNR